MRIDQLCEVLPEKTFYGDEQRYIKGLCNHAQKANPGDFFIARQGLTCSGKLFIPQAVARGAVAVLADQYDEAISITQVIVENPNYCEALLAEKFFSSPSRELALVGVTGTNGKSTVSWLIWHMLKGRGPAGLLSTVLRDLGGGAKFKSTVTTPDVIMTQSCLRDMVLNGCNHAVMEVSSHGLDQGRVAGLHFRVGVFTNLSREHLDYHKTLANYGSAKKKLFEMLPCDGVMVVNNDDPFGQTLLKEHKAHSISFGVDGGELQAQGIEFGAESTCFFVCYKNKRIPVHAPLIGLFNVYNLLAAFGALLALGYTLEEMAHRVQSFPGVPGRMEAVANAQGKKIFVDYAHSPDALERVLQSLQLTFPGAELSVIFGCGGGRDKEKRPFMGQIACQYADKVYLTTDNPRNEQPQEIVRDIFSGCVKYKEKVYIEYDRRKAIARAIENGCAKGVILVAGKGHEEVQISGGAQVPFSDIKAIQEIMGQGSIEV